MEPDGLMPGGTFVEFSWYSFESDGPMGDMPGPLDSADALRMQGDDMAAPEGGEDAPAGDRGRAPSTE